MRTTQKHFPKVENKIPPHPKLKRKNPVELISANISLEFAILRSGAN
jgi:hypothetical protein